MPNSILPVVAIIGRPNVGKSALFNRLIQRRKALVDATPGLTRDRLYGEVVWRGIRFRVVDTGGLQFIQADRISERIAIQVAKAMEEADLALFLCDAREGLVPLDLEVASWARRWSKPILLVANKADDPKSLQGTYEFSRLGFGEVLPVSSLHGLRVGELLEAIIEKLASLKLNRPEVNAGDEPAVPVRVAIVGRPNVGKSSFLNRVLNEERVLVDETPGTTRDCVEVGATLAQTTLTLIDTAGVRARRKLREKIDILARIKSVEAIHQADVCLGILEAPLGLVQDDLKLLDQVMESAKPVILCLNKWDLIPRSVRCEEAVAQLRRRAPFLRFSPAVCMSATTGLNVRKALEMAVELAQRARQRIPEAQCRRLVALIQQDPKAPVGIRHAHLFRILQVDVAPPTFHFLIRVRQGLRGSDVSYLEAVFRRELKLEGIPLRIRLMGSGA